MGWIRTNNVPLRTRAVQSRRLTNAQPQHIPRRVSTSGRDRTYVNHVKSMGHYHSATKAKVDSGEVESPLTPLKAECATNYTTNPYVGVAALFISHIASFFLRSSSPRINSCLLLLLSTLVVIFFWILPTPVLPECALLPQ